MWVLQAQIKSAMYVGVEAGLIFGKGLRWGWINTFADNGKKVTLARQ